MKKRLLVCHGCKAIGEATGDVLTSLPPGWSRVRLLAVCSVECAGRLETARAATKGA